MNSEMSVNEARSVLGLGNNATPDEIKKAVRSLMVRYHPDKHVGASEDLIALAQREFSRVRTAGDILLAELDSPRNGAVESEPTTHSPSSAQEQLSRAMHWASVVPPNFEEAAKWLHQAATQGNVDAQAILGAWYTTGTGVTQDFGQAATWLSMAAGQGNANAQCQLGVLYLNGTGVPHDLNQAMFWFRKGAEQGLVNAQTWLGLTLAGAEGLQQDLNQAAQWFLKAADQGDAVGQWALGLCYANGKGVPQDHYQAEAWFSLAAEQNHPGAQTELGTLWLHGIGIPRDRNQGMYWLRKGADQGWADAQFQMGYALSGIEGVGRDDTQAAEWFLKAAQQGHAGAQYQYGCCCRDGKGVSKNPEVARGWFLQAIQNGGTVAVEALADLDAEAQQWRGASRATPTTIPRRRVPASNGGIGPHPRGPRKSFATRAAVFTWFISACGVTIFLGVINGALRNAADGRVNWVDLLPSAGAGVVLGACAALVVAGVVRMWEWAFSGPSQVVASPEPVPAVDYRQRRVNIWSSIYAAIGAIVVGLAAGFQIVFPMHWVVAAFLGLLAYLIGFWFWQSVIRFEDSVNKSWDDMFR